MRQFRVKYEIQFEDCQPSVRADKKKLRTLAAAQLRSLLYGPEPWLAFGKGPNDEWCHGKASAENCTRYGDPEDPGCGETHSTAREFWNMRRAEFSGKILRVWIEERTVSSWTEAQQ